jgi:hypothetical protein
MESDLSNPAALAYWDNVDESALEAVIRPQAVFADVQIQGTLSDNPLRELLTPEPAATATAATGLAIDPKWLAVLAIIVLAIGAYAVLNERH